MSTISTQITTDALKAQATSNDGVAVSRRSLSELIAADKYLRATAAVGSPAANFRLMTTKVVAPGGH